MDNRKTAEIGVVLIGYILVFIVIIGPAIGAVSGFNAPAIDFSSSGTRWAPTSIRGLVLVITTAVVMVGYMYLRAKIAGVTPQEYWGR